MDSLSISKYYQEFRGEIKRIQTLYHESRKLGQNERAKELVHELYKLGFNHNIFLREFQKATEKIGEEQTLKQKRI
ncbi:MAG: hypothetical protein WCX73_00095 [Candidatus Pacearchaeota archaeon]|jgi:hypothetical protein